MEIKYLLLGLLGLRTTFTGERHQKPFVVLGVFVIDCSTSLARTSSSILELVGLWYNKMKSEGK